MHLPPSKKIATIAVALSTGLFFLLLIGLLVGWVILPGQFSTIMSKKTRVNISIRAIPLSLNPISINGLEIGNPKEYRELPAAFTAEKIRISAPITTYLEERIVIDEIALDDVYLGLQFESVNRIGQGNWPQIVDNLGKSNANEEQEISKSKKNPHVLIKRLVIRNLQTEILYGHDKKEIGKLPLVREMVFTDISTDKGAPIGQIMNSVLGKMLVTITAKKQIEAFKNNFDLPKKTNETLDKAGEVLDKLKDAFSK